MTSFFYFAIFRVILYFWLHVFKRFEMLVTLTFVKKQSNMRDQEIKYFKNVDKNQKRPQAFVSDNATWEINVH